MVYTESLFPIGFCVILPPATLNTLRRAQLPLEEVVLEEGTHHWLQRFNTYQRMDLPLSAVLEGRGMEWENAAWEGPLLIDGWSQLPITGLSHVAHARANGSATVQAWVGVYPSSDWKPSGEVAREDFEAGQWQVEQAQRKAPLDHGWLLGLKEDIPGPRAANYVDHKGVSLLGAVLARLNDSVRLEDQAAVFEGLGFLLEQGASVRQGTFSSLHQNGLQPWVLTMERFLPSPGMLDPERQIPLPLLDLFLSSDLDLADPFVRRRTQIWLDRWIPNAKQAQSPEEQTMYRLKHRWLDALNPAPLAPSPRIRL